MDKILFGDCLKYLNDINNDSIDLIVTDPPYLITSRGNAGNSGGMFQKKISMPGKVFKHNSIKPIEYIPTLFRVLKDGGHFYIMSNHVNLQDILNTATNSGFKFVKSLIWDKGNKIMGGYYMSQFEYILFFRKGRGKKINHCGTADLIRVPNKKQKDSQGKNLHDTEKPVALMEVLIANSSDIGDIILDPFMGIGSTGVACANLDRKFVGIELDKRYFDIAEAQIKRARSCKSN